MRSTFFIILFFALLVALTAQEPLAAKERLETVIFEGEPLRGEIILIKQVHFPPTIPGSKDHWQPKDVLAFEEAIGYYQLTILKDLLALKPTYVFVEGYSGEELSKESPIISLCKSVIEGNFPEPLEYKVRGITPPRISYTQTILLKNWGAAFVYVALNEKAVIKPAAMPVELRNAKLLELLAGSQKELTLEDLRQNKLREEYALTQVKAFLEKHPGERCVLVFGCGHDFDFSVFKELKIRVTSIYYPGIARETVVANCELERGSQRRKIRPSQFRNVSIGSKGLYLHNRRMNQRLYQHYCVQPIF